MFLSKLSPLDMMKLLPLAALVATPLFLAGCESEENRKLAAGQACLDSARNDSDADRCLTLVQGLESESAYLIRCSANFIAQGFTGTRIANAYEQMKDAPASQNPTSAMLSLVVFAKALPNHTVDNAALNCQKSGVRSMVRLVTVAQMATLIANPGGALTDLVGFDPTKGDVDPNLLKDKINDLINNAGDPTNAAAIEQIGTIAETASTAYCNEGSAYKESDICKTLDTALASGGTPDQIGKDLLDLLKNAGH